jgi:phosphopantothenoylcysteine decarboxylase/phosphopantothenate--cysteine ligase
MTERERVATAGPGARLEGRFVALGVTGSIAAYKSAELARRLIDEGAEVQVLLSRSAREFIGALTFETLTRRPVMSDPLELLSDGRIAHIVVADTADVIVVAPATARWIAAMAAGLSDDVITAACLASAAPVVVAPAMDGEMYAHPATRSNVERLRSFGYAIVEPEEGALASGQRGVGRLAATEAIVEAVVAAVQGRPIRADAAARPPKSSGGREPDLVGRRVLVTAGGTMEPIDPVRFVGNRSSGKMGAAIAKAALDRGADVTLIAGNVDVDLPDGATIVRVETADEMRGAVLDALPAADALVMAAAVADFRPSRPREAKIERGQGLTLELEPTADILAEVASVAHDRSRRDGKAAPVLVGFAAETGSLARAADKLHSKGVDLLVANDVSAKGSGFGSETNRVTVLATDGTSDEWPLLPKRDVADRLLDRIAALWASGTGEAERARSAALAGSGARR